ncbi:MAG: HAD hydrolase family protein [Prolixibacteraceae bacterium]|jgi:3-deoxy-D-manno-octulosonate 8-phosphate phosphatase (KDO 8-P phosphatase)|nr:HAD hydrolase family protein [Prolixibacteraceae bacterium]
MAFFKEELLNVKAFIFDVDGVLSSDTSPLDQNGEPMRTANVKDGFAIRNALLSGYPVAIISGGKNENIKKRYEKLGIEHIYIAAGDKITCFEDILNKTKLAPEDFMYMGDDLPDYNIMMKIGIPTCPADAVTEIKSISKYISDRKGGQGCVRDVIEQVMRAQGKWLNPDIIRNPSF